MRRRRLGTLMTVVALAALAMALVKVRVYRKPQYDLTVIEGRAVGIEVHLHINRVPPLTLDRCYHYWNVGIQVSHGRPRL